MYRRLLCLLLVCLPGPVFGQTEKQVAEYVNGYLRKAIGSPNRESNNLVSALLRKTSLVSVLNSRIAAGTTVFDTGDEQVTNAVGIYIRHKRFRVYESFRINPGNYFVSLEINRDNSIGLTTKEEEAASVLGPTKFSYFVTFTISDRSDIRNVRIFGTSYDGLHFTRYHCSKGDFVYCVRNESSLGSNEGRARLLVFSVAKHFRLVYQRRLFDSRVDETAQILEMCKFRFRDSKVIIEGTHFETENKKATSREVKEIVSLGGINISAN